MTLRGSSSLFLVLFVIGSVLWVGREALSQPFILGGNGAHASGIMHKILPGETLSQITQKYDVDLHHLMEANGIKETTRLQSGDLLLIPETADVDRYVSYAPANKRWEYIVIHHSATERGNAEIFDLGHRKRGFVHGLGYHFVINNGTYGTKLGEIHTGDRWFRQREGAHCRAMNMNEKGIGICLVGNFNQSGVPPEQLHSAMWLVKHLQKQYGIPDENVIRHRDAKVNGTDCPGDHFPWLNFRRILA